ncbi:hypothetical protein OIDMADRAFT_172967 [Oidiodendron maius Zn]|uniref:Zn(2)-C6 fungal-type domain-containing protein n=1 Tax=Oidiodendron maius (strain Zn) TaxID=913774 RepID=A0A0C3GRA7_OIDMZ|nr:hypothetical protein OIDMADRAFT_172967 [Oidiodendron maius Zn]
MPLDQLGVTEVAEVDRKAGLRVSLACIPCRTRHIRCDASTPSCSRCQPDNRACSYTKSKRGGQRSKLLRRQAALDADMPRRPDVRDHLQFQSASNTAPMSLSAGTTPEISDTSGSHSSAHDDGDHLSRQLRDSYYTNFHDAHPILLPQVHLMARLQSNSASLQHVMLVMEYIGSLYLPHIPSEGLKERISNELVTGNLSMTGFSVQALMLFALATHCCNNFGEARVLLDTAITMALEIKMQSRLFAYESGEGNDVMEESWRRTWWLLFIIDGTFAGIRHEKSFKLLNINTDVDLPCEEREYAQGTIPTPKLLEEYETREFADEEITFSSFAYLIDGARIAGAVLAASSDTGEAYDPVATPADAKLVSWIVHLPECKKQMINENRSMDEVIFQAHMLINLLGLYLHRPRSRLAYSSVEGTSKCTPAPLAEQMMGMRQTARALHTNKALESLESLLGMMTLPTPIMKHTPLIICALAMAIMGQISACRLVLEPKEVIEARERIRLGIGALRAFTEIWPLGRKTILEMKTIARELLNIPHAKGNETPVGQVLTREGVYTSSWSV